MNLREEVNKAKKRQNIEQIKSQLEELKKEHKELVIFLEHYEDFSYFIRKLKEEKDETDKRLLNEYFPTEKHYIAAKERSLAAIRISNAIDYKMLKDIQNRLNKDILDTEEMLSKLN